MPPRAAATRSLPCSLDAGCAGFYAGAWRKAVRGPPKAAAARSLPCSLDAGCAGFYAGARHPGAKRRTCYLYVGGCSPSLCSLDAGGAGSKLVGPARSGPCAIDIAGNHDCAGSSMLDTWLPQHSAFCYERNLRPHGRNIPDNSREKAATASFTVMNASS